MEGAGLFNWMLLNDGEGHMGQVVSEAELTEWFRELGVADPEAWARSQIVEGIPQYLRALFLKQAWEHVTTEGDISWIDKEITSAEATPASPYAGLGQALARCRERGVDDKDLIEISRCLQAQMLFSLVRLIDGPGPAPRHCPELSWGLFETDADGRPIGPQIAGLHESALEFDPTGREMRPKGANPVAGLSSAMSMGQLFSYLSSGKPLICEIEVSPFDCEFWPIQDLATYNKEYQVPEYAPGYFCFATSGGGELYAIAPDGAIVCLPAIGMEPRYANLLAADWATFEMMLRPA